MTFANLIELKTSEVSYIDINVSNNKKIEKVSSYAVYNYIEVQTSKKPKSESCVRYIEEFSKTAEVLTSRISTFALLKN